MEQFEVLGDARLRGELRDGPCERFEARRVRLSLCTCDERVARRSGHEANIVVVGLVILTGEDRCKERLARLGRAQLVGEPRAGLGAAEERREQERERDLVVADDRVKYDLDGCFARGGCVRVCVCA